MTKTDYMKILATRLHRLPREDYEKAIAYFEEYFAEAGVENEQQAIEDLGTPQDAANELIMNLAQKNVQEPPKTVKHGLTALWIGVLGVCATPIALPFALSLLTVILGFVLIVLGLIFCLFLTAIVLAGGGIISVFIGGILLFSTFADGLATIGLGLCTLGTGILLIYGATIFCRWFLRKTSKSLGNITKRRKGHESNH